MTIEEKTSTILNDIAKHNKTFISQAKWKLNKRIANGPTDHIELVSDVIFSIIKKLDDPASVDRFYVMAINNKLYVYILKGIDSNCKFLNAPYLRHKIKLMNRIPLRDDHLYEDDEDEELMERAAYIKSLLEPHNAKLIFGDEWKLFITLLTDYIENPHFTYKDLSTKYNIPLGSISWTMKVLKTKLLKAIHEKK